MDLFRAKAQRRKGRKKKKGSDNTPTLWRLEYCYRNAKGERGYTDETHLRGLKTLIFS
ncbi:hypothetical protein [Nodularia sp. NIES-3585]|uniref:hypothetical protein n=1 Tax=Nodularia sp. NIES-3585 TaxID=1973477 RepID=UPI001595B461|nr:hypothetical protein [Nodularia sp. NIES-3585]